MFGKFPGGGKDSRLLHRATIKNMRAKVFLDAAFPKLRSCAHTPDKESPLGTAAAIQGLCCIVTST